MSEHNATSSARAFDTAVRGGNPECFEGEGVSKMGKDGVLRVDVRLALDALGADEEKVKLGRLAWIYNGYALNPDNLNVARFYVPEDRAESFRNRAFTLLDEARNSKGAAGDDISGHRGLVISPGYAWA